MVEIPYMTDEIPYKTVESPFRRQGEPQSEGRGAVPKRLCLLSRSESPGSFYLGRMELGLVNRDTLVRRRQFSQP